MAITLTWRCGYTHREVEEITSFIKGAICDDQCLGRCLYIHGVPGTGKVTSIGSKSVSFLQLF